MAETTNIEWCDSTFNPWIGCTKVSPGCDNCYAERDMSSRLKVVQWGPGNERQRTKPANWKKVEKWNREPFVECPECGWRGEWREADVRNGCCPSCNHLPRLFKPARRRVFCASLADVFDNEVPVAWRVDLVELIVATPNLDWLILTKRIGNVSRMWPAEPIPNVWLGISVVNQEEADRDIPKLLAAPAALRWLSIEPMLGPIALTPAYLPCPNFEHVMMCPETGSYECCGECDFTGISSEIGIDWVVVGGESGPKARPIHPNWVRSLRDECAAAGVPMLFKQWGEWAPSAANSGANGDGLMARVGKKAAGRLLDRAEIKQWPQCEAPHNYGAKRDMTKAPWPDFSGKDIHEGDTITHPSGESGTVVFLADETDPGDQWRVDYGTAGLSRLCLQIGDKGRAVVTPNA